MGNIVLLGSMPSKEQHVKTCHGIYLLLELGNLRQLDLDVISLGLDGALEFLDLVGSIVELPLDADAAQFALAEVLVQSLDLVVGHGDVRLG